MPTQNTEDIFEHLRQQLRQTFAHATISNIEKGKNYNGESQRFTVTTDGAPTVDIYYSPKDKDIILSAMVNNQSTEQTFPLTDKDHLPAIEDSVRAITSPEVA